MTATWTATLWSDDITTEEHRELALARLIWQYRGDQPRLQGALDAFIQQVQNLEDVALEMLTNRWPLTAVGDQLDLLGRIVVQKRGSLTDDEYRIIILCRILANRSNGRHDELVNIIETAGIAGSIQVDESWPCGVVISVSGAEHGWVIGGIVGDAVGAGVDHHWSWTSHSDDEAFAMGDTLGADETDADGGFGDLGGSTQTTGGYYTGGARL